MSRIFTAFANFGNSSHDKSKEWQKNSLLLSRIWVSISVVLTKRQKIDTWFLLRQNYLTNFGLQQEKNESAHSPTHNQNSKEKKMMRNECPTLLYLTKFFWSLSNRALLSNNDIPRIRQALGTGIYTIYWGGGKCDGKDGKGENETRVEKKRKADALSAPIPDALLNMEWKKRNKKRTGFLFFNDPPSRWWFRYQTSPTDASTRTKGGRWRMGVRDLGHVGT